MGIIKHVINYNTMCSQFNLALVFFCFNLDPSLMSSSSESIA